MLYRKRSLPTWNRPIQSLNRYSNNTSLGPKSSFFVGSTRRSFWCWYCAGRYVQANSNICCKTIVAAHITSLILATNPSCGVDLYKYRSLPEYRNFWIRKTCFKSICLCEFLFFVWFIQISAVSFLRDKSTFLLERFYAEGRIFTWNAQTPFRPLLLPLPLTENNSHSNMHTWKLGELSKLICYFRDSHIWFQWESINWTSLFVDDFGGKEIICNLCAPKNCQD